jgi:VWFA-related protein
VLLVSVATPGATQQDPWTERVEVTRVLVDARVFGSDGRPITDLGPSDFRVTIDGKAAPVESAEWVGLSPAEVDGPRAEGTVGPQDPSARVGIATGWPGRLVVFLVQKDFEAGRIVGLMQMGQLADRLLESMTPGDRAAVLSFDTRLHIWSDFTSDFARVRSILAKHVITSHPGPAQPSRWPSLMDRLDTRTTARASGIEHALRYIGEALEPLPGAKSLVLLGYGFGRFDPSSGGVILMDGYADASAALQRARVAVFTLNVTQAHYNSLQAGLQTVSAETGGLYASTYEFPNLAIRQVNHALAGYYVLFVEKPAVATGGHRIEVRLIKHQGVVVARASFVDAR